MIAYLLRSLATQLASGRTLFGLTLAGVALGVGSVLSIQILNRNALGAFEGSVRAISGEADFSIVADGPGLSEERFPEVLAVPGVAAAWPVVRLDVALAGRADEFLDVVGLDLFAAGRIPWEEASGAATTTSNVTGSPVLTPGWVAVSLRLAERFGWQVGDPFTVTSGSRSVELTIGARIDFRRITPLAGSRMLVMDIAQAQSAFGLDGRLQQIDIVAADGADVAGLRGEIDGRLGPDERTVSLDDRSREAADLLGAFRLNLTSLSLISLVVGAFLVHTSTQAALVRRRAEFGVLRSTGTTRGRVLALILGQVLLVGVLGTAIGIPLGYLAAGWNVDLVSGTLSNLYLLESIESLRVPVGLYVLAAAVGLGGAIVGGLGPALEIGREDPRTLLAAFPLHERFGRGARRWLIAGVATLASAVAVWWLFLRDARPGGFVVALGLLFALPLAAPWTVQHLTGALPLRGFGLRYGVKALGLRLQTAAFAVAALSVAVAMLVGVTVMIASFRRTVEIWLDSTLKADVYVTTESWKRARAAATLEPEVLAELEATPGVVHVDKLRQFFVRSGGRRIALTGVDMTLPEETGRFEMVRGDRRAALRRLAEDGAALISEPLSLKAGLRAGDVLEIDGARGPVAFPIAGVFYDYSSDRGGAAIDLRMMERHFGPGAVSNVALYLDDGQDVEQRVSALRARFSGRPLLIRSNRDLRQEVFRIFDQTFAVTRLLQAMCLLIAVCGITLALIVLARERVSELALYRALGASRRSIFAVFLGKGTGIAGFGLLLGLPAGIALAWVLIYLINRTWFGWTIATHWPVAILLRQAGWILLAALLASVYPAVRASRTPATELSRENL